MGLLAILYLYCVVYAHTLGSTELESGCSAARASFRSAEDGDISLFFLSKDSTKKNATGRREAKRGGITGSLETGCKCDSSIEIDTQIHRLLLPRSPSYTGDMTSLLTTHALELLTVKVFGDF